MFALSLKEASQSGWDESLHDRPPRVWLLQWPLWLKSCPPTNNMSHCLFVALWRVPGKSRRSRPGGCTKHKYARHAPRGSWARQRLAHKTEQIFPAPEGPKRATGTFCNQRTKLGEDNEENHHVSTGWETWPSLCVVWSSGEQNCFDLPIRNYSHVEQ